MGNGPRNVERELRSAFLFGGNPKELWYRWIESFRETDRSQMSACEDWMDSHASSVILHAFSIDIIHGRDQSNLILSPFSAHACSVVLTTVAKRLCHTPLHLLPIEMQLLSRVMQRTNSISLSSVRSFKANNGRTCVMPSISLSCLPSAFLPPSFVRSFVRYSTSHTFALHQLQAIAFMREAFNISFDQSCCLIKAIVRLKKRQRKKMTALSFLPSPSWSRCLSPRLESKLKGRSFAIAPQAIRQASSCSKRTFGERVREAVFLPAAHSFSPPFFSLRLMRNFQTIPSDNKKANVSSDIYHLFRFAVWSFAFVLWRFLFLYDILFSKPILTLYGLHTYLYNSK